MISHKCQKFKIVCENPTFQDHTFYPDIKNMRCCGRYYHMEMAKAWFKKRFTRNGEGGGGARDSAEEKWITEVGKRHTD